MDNPLKPDWKVRLMIPVPTDQNIQRADLCNGFEPLSLFVKLVRTYFKLDEHHIPFSMAVAQSHCPRGRVESVFL